jgi:cytochrome c551/c552
VEVKSVLIWLKRFLAAVAVFMAIAQIYRPARTNPPIEEKQEIGATLAVGPVIASILDRSCNDCHSNRTVWPWYSNVAPVSWLVVSDVNRGRRRVNFSEWESYTADKRSKLLEAICKEVTEGDMPPATYTPMHSSASLTKADAREICRWTVLAQQTIVATNGVKS